MALLVAIVASHLTGIAGGTLLLTLNGIVSYCLGGVFFLFCDTPASFFAIGLGKLIETGRSGGLAVGQLYFLGLGLLGTGFFGSGPLGLHLRGSIVGRAVAPGTTDIRFSDYGARF